MSTSEERYQARHAVPRGSAASGAAVRRPTSARVAATAAAIVAGAVPLACAGAAQAATNPLGDFAGAIPTGVTLPTSDTPIGLNGAQLPVNQATMALAHAQAALADGTQRLGGRLSSALPLGNMMPAVMPDPTQPLQVAPNVLKEGAIGTLSQGLAPQAQEITGSVVGQATPLVGRLHQSGVPTVGDVTGQVSKTALPGVGSVGGLTQSLPVTAALGPDSPVTGAVNSLGGL